MRAEHLKDGNQTENILTFTVERKCQLKIRGIHKTEENPCRNPVVIKCQKDFCYTKKDNATTRLKLIDNKMK